MKTFLKNWRLFVVVVALIAIPVSCAILMQNLDKISLPNGEAQGAQLKEADKSVKITASQQYPIIIIYSASWCKYCKVAKLFFEEMKIPYIEKNMNNPEHYKELTEFAAKVGYTGELNAVPLFIIKNKVILGFSKKEILCLIGLSKCYTVDFTRSKTELD